MQAFGEIDHGWSQHLREYSKCHHRSFTHAYRPHIHTLDIYYSLGMRVHAPSELTCFMPGASEATFDPPVVLEVVSAFRLS